MARCMRCNKFLLFSTKSGYCPNCDILITKENAAKERKAREEMEKQLRAEEDKRRAEEEMRRKAEEARKAEEERQRKAEEERHAEEERQRKAEKARKAEEDRRRIAEEARRVEEERLHKVEEEQRKKQEKSEKPNHDSNDKKSLSLHAGDSVKFGKYIQGVSGSEPEDIEWIVLEIEGGQALLVSQYILDYQAYPEGAEYTINPVPWSKSHLRKWLNSYFYNTAFNQAQQKAICEVTITTNNPIGKDTSTDRVFLLSLEESHDNNGSLNPMLLETEQTVYAVHADELMARDSWWLRSDYPEVDMEHRPGYFASYLDEKGNILSGMKATHLQNGVRPAFWADISQLITFVADTNTEQDKNEFNILMDAHADPNCRRVSHQGGGDNPALCDAISEGRTAMAERLIRAGADVNAAIIINGRRISAMQCAMYNNDFRLINLLQSYGAR